MSSTPLGRAANRRDLARAVRGVAWCGRSFLGPGAPLKAVVEADGVASCLVGSPWRLLEHLAGSLGTHPGAIVLVDAVHALLRRTGSGATWFLALVACLGDALTALEDRHGLAPDDALQGLEDALERLASDVVPSLTLPLGSGNGTCAGARGPADIRRAARRLAHGRAFDMAVAARAAAALATHGATPDRVLVHATAGTRHGRGSAVLPGIGITRVARGADDAAAGDDGDADGSEAEAEAGTGAVLVFPGLALTGRVVSAVSGWDVYMDALRARAREAAKGEEAWCSGGSMCGGDAFGLRCVCVGTLGDAAEQGMLAELVCARDGIGAVFCGDAALPTQACLEAFASHGVLLVWGLQRVELARCDAAFGCRTAVRPSLLSPVCVGAALEAFALLDAAQVGDLGVGATHPNYADPQLQRGAAPASEAGVGADADGSALLGTSRERRTFSEPFPVLLRSSRSPGDSVRGSRPWITVVAAPGGPQGGARDPHAQDRVWVCLDRLNAVLSSGRVLPGAGRWEILAAAALRNAHPDDPGSAAAADALEAVVLIALDNGGLEVHTALAVLARARACAAAGVHVPTLVPDAAAASHDAGGLDGAHPDQSADDPRARTEALRQAARLLRLLWGASSAITYRPPHHHVHP